MAHDGQNDHQMNQYSLSLKKGHGIHKDGLILLKEILVSPLVNVWGLQSKEPVNILQIDKRMQLKKLTNKKKVQHFLWNIGEKAKSVLCSRVDHVQTTVYNLGSMDLCLNSFLSFLQAFVASLILRRSLRKTKLWRLVSLLNHFLHNSYESPPALGSWLILWS